MGVCKERGERTLVYAVLPVSTAACTRYPQIPYCFLPALLFSVVVEGTMRMAGTAGEGRIATLIDFNGTGIRLEGSETM